ncbi:MAG: phosphotransferase family protein, partial [Acidimicrobiales bacterium]
PGPARRPPPAARRPPPAARRAPPAFIGMCGCLSIRFVPSRDRVSTAGMEDALRAVLEPVLGTGVEVGDLTRLSGGSSRETWGFSARRPDGGVERLVLRRDPPGTGSSGLPLETDVLAAAARAGVPVPRLVAAGGASGVLGGAFVVVEHVDGETIPRRILRDERFASARGVLAAQCGEILAAVHRIPPADVPGLTGGDQLEQLRSLLDTLGQPHPALELGLRWLAANRLPRSAEVVVHGDFRNGNLIVGPDGVRAVLDWELAHRGDPLEDLGWLCVKAWRFGSALPAGGFGTVDELVDAYERAAAVHVDRRALAWWEMLGTLRWGIICIVQAMTHTSGALRSVELAAIGRRVCEVEWDLLELLP